MHPLKLGVVGVVQILLVIAKDIPVLAQDPNIQQLMQEGQALAAAIRAAAAAAPQANPPAGSVAPAGPG